MVPKPKKTFQRLQRANVLISVYWEQGCCAESALYEYAGREERPPLTPSRLKGVAWRAPGTWCGQGH